MAAELFNYSKSGVYTDRVVEVHNGGSNYILRRAYVIH